MMEWTDEGMLLSMRKHGEGSAIIEVFTQNHGRHAGVVRGGGSRKSAALLQPGAQLAVKWRARLEEHLGSFTVEPIYSRVANIMSGRTEISAFAAIAALVSTCLPERENQNRFYEQTMELVQRISADPVWLASYVRWELSLLSEIGFGLDLSCCAANGSEKDLRYVSPKSAQAVSLSGATGWEDKLLKLPDFLKGINASTPSFPDIMDGLKLTEYFLTTRVMPALGCKETPQARARFVKTISRP